MNVVAIVQARMDSRRLPGKVLELIENKPLLWHIVTRLKACRNINRIIVATSSDKSDDAIADFCHNHGIPYFRGSKDNVLDRYYQAAQRERADVIVRITGDSPLIDAQWTDATIKYYLDKRDSIDYVTNAHPPTLPDGLDTEVFSFGTLERTWRAATTQYQKEHVTPFIVEHNEFRKNSIKNSTDLSHMRWCVDEPQDIQFVRAVYKELYNGGSLFTMQSVLDLLQRKPELEKINNTIGRNDGLKKSLEEEQVDKTKFSAYFKKGLKENERMYIRQVTERDATEEYVAWLNDKEVSKYLESRFQQHTMESVKKYITASSDDKKTLFFAVIAKDKEKHIGNVKIVIDEHHNNATLGIMLGDKNYWGKGYGSEAIALASEYVFEEKGLHKIHAYVAAINKSSAKAFEKAGFAHEATMKQNVLIDGIYYDTFIYGFVNPEERFPIITKSNELWERAIKILPGGTQTASKAPNQFVNRIYPKYIQRGNGSHVWDVDGNEYIDYPSSLGVNILGHAYPRVVEAIEHQAREGTIFSLMHPLEVEVAEILTKEIPCAEKIRFVKNGSDATSAAVRIARAYTNREKIAACGYHGWQDWYVISTEKKKGIPKVLEQYTLRFEYNNIDSLKKIFTDNQNQIAAVILEATVNQEPKNNFLEQVKALAKEHGAVLIFDEIVTGFRFGLGGAQKYFNVIPDLACFGKCIANGLPLSLVCGKKEIMDECDNIFLSLTYGGEAISLAAALATLHEIKEKNVVEHIWHVGKKFKESYNKITQELGIQSESIGYPPRQNIIFKEEKGFTPNELYTLFLQETIARGILIGNVVVFTYSHSEQDVEKTLDACKSALQYIRDGIDKGDLRKRIKGDIKGEVFRQKQDEKKA
ncbi:aminotransferase class III-fold pyridoxal phosphate-dependent enzyme [Candidatus Woesearchaeota archaeon]|nr:aminotransferase class III-fold pyridoxal phosphate-dependent enzyme [Candidatus Woesearchaeota archaeon]